MSRMLVDSNYPLPCATILIDNPSPLTAHLGDKPRGSLATTPQHRHNLSRQRINRTRAGHRLVASNPKTRQNVSSRLHHPRTRSAEFGGFPDGPKEFCPELCGLLYRGISLPSEGSVGLHITPLASFIQNYLLIPLVFPPLDTTGTY